MDKEAKEIMKEVMAVITHYQSQSMSVRNLLLLQKMLPKDVRDKVLKLTEVDPAVGRQIERLRELLEDTP